MAATVVRAGWIVPLSLWAGAAVCQSPPPARSLGPVVAASSAIFGSVNHFAELSDGRVLISDAERRTVWMLDTSLQSAIVVLDPRGGRPNSYTNGSGGRALDAKAFAETTARLNFLVRIRGDSVLWYDWTSAGFLVLAPGGGAGRVFATPPYRGTTSFASRAPPGWADAAGLVYQVARPVDNRSYRLTRGQTIRVFDSSSVLRLNIDTRRVDTITAIASGTDSWLTREDSRYVAADAPPLFPFADGVATTADGWIAVFRAREFRIDWFGPEGQRIQWEQLATRWRRPSDEEKRRIVDSVNALRMIPFDSATAAWVADSIRLGRAPTKPVTHTVGSVTVTRQERVPRPSKPRMATTDEIPDHMPPETRHPLLADADNRLWLRANPDQPEPGYDLWDIISRRDGVIDRVRVPQDRTIAGFGRDGAVYLVPRDTGFTVIEKVKIRP